MTNSIATVAKRNTKALGIRRECTVLPESRSRVGFVNDTKIKAEKVSLTKKKGGEIKKTATGQPGKR